MEHIAVVGAGLVGSLLSLHLASLGFKVSVYERSQDPRQVKFITDRSINITLCERGFQALDAVGVGDLVRRYCIPVYGRVIHDLNGNLAYQPYGNHQEAIYSIGREDLVRVLVEFAAQQDNINLFFAHKCLDIDIESASLTLENLQSPNIQTVKFDRIFAADGAFSVVRRKMQRLKRFNYSQEYCEQGYKEIIIAATEKGDWALEKNAIHIWPRESFMLIGFPNLDGSFTLSLHLPYEGKISHQSIQTPAALEHLFEAYFADIWLAVQSQIDDYFEKSIEPMVTIKCFPWIYQDKIALIGDASHAIFPSYGQGANAGFEDCQILANCIQDNFGDWTTILQEYQKLRKPNTDTIADLCYEHFKILMYQLGSEQFLKHKLIEREIQEIYPQQTSLYYNISFTTMSYLDAAQAEQDHQRLVRRLASIPNIEDQLTSHAIDLRTLITSLP
jgi:kynurenine 3-monooxygenase